MVAPTAIQKRNAAIIEARREGKGSLRQLAAEHGISTERVRQISEAGGVSNDDAARAYTRAKRGRAFDDANEHASAILMRFIMGENGSEIAHGMGLPVRAVQEVLDEQITDEILAARSNARMARQTPDIDAGPMETADPRDDRYWTAELVLEKLIKLAKQQGGRLPSSTQYQRLAPTRDDLPSFSTVRNRLGRWTSVRVNIHAQLRGS